MEPICVIEESDSDLKGTFISSDEKSNDLECYKWSGDDSFLIAR